MTFLLEVVWKNLTACNNSRLQKLSLTTVEAKCLPQKQRRIPHFSTSWRSWFLWLSSHLPGLFPLFTSPSLHFFFDHAPHLPRASWLSDALPVSSTSCWFLALARALCVYFPLENFFYFWVILFTRVEPEDELNLSIFQKFHLRYTTLWFELNS